MECHNCKVIMKRIYVRTSNTYYDFEKKKHQKRTLNVIGDICPRCHNVILLDSITNAKLKGSYLKRKPLSYIRKINNDEDDFNSDQM